MVSATIRGKSCAVSDWSKMVPRVHTIDMRLKIGESFYLSPIFDAHIDDALCDFDALKEMADQRRDLPNHQALWIGDFCNLVMPPDIRRFRPSVQPEGIARRDDWLNATTDYVIKRLEELDLKHTLFSPGNHEDSTLKYHGYDITTLIAAHFGARRGGYSGVLDYVIYISKTQKCTFRILWHHGAWGGRYAKGYLGALPFFNQFDSWNLGLYGHCHAVRGDPELRRHVHNGRIEQYVVRVVNCGQWVESYPEDASITYYAESKGHLPQPKMCPLIKVTPRMHYHERGHCGHSGRDNRLYADCSVEV